MKMDVSNENQLNDRYVRENQILLKLISANDTASNYLVLESLANALYVSRTTISQDIKRINKDIRSYSLEISGTTNKGVRLKGKEFNIRNLIIHRLFDSYTEKFSQHYSDLPKKYQRLLSRIFSDFSMNTEEQTLMKKNIVVLCIRNYVQHPIIGKIEHYQNFFGDDVNLRSLRDQLSDELGYKISSYEFDYLCFPVNLGTKKINNYKKNHTSDILDDMLERIYSEYQFYIAKHYLNVEIRNHLMFLVNRIVFSIPPDLSLDYKIEKNYPFAYQISKSAISVIEEKLKLHINSQEISLLALYFQLAIQKNYQVNKKFAIVQNIGTSLVSFIEERIRRVYFHNCEFIEVSEDVLETLNPEEINAVFSDHDVDLKLNIPVIQVSNVFSDRYLRELIREGEASVLLNNEYLRYNLTVYADVERLDSYEELVINRLTTLKKSHIIKQSFVDGILKQEVSKISYGSIYIPHALLDNSDKYLLDVGIHYSQKKSLDYRVIVMIGIPNNMVEGKEVLLVDIYDYIFKIINQIQAFTTKQELIALAEVLKGKKEVYEV